MKILKNYIVGKEKYESAIFFNLEERRDVEKLKCLIDLSELENEKTFEITTLRIDHKGYKGLFLLKK